MPDTPDRAVAPAHEPCAQQPDVFAAEMRTTPPATPAATAPDVLRRALADARSPRVPALSPYVPEHPFPWNGRSGLPLSDGGGRRRAATGTARRRTGTGRPVPRASTGPAGTGPVSGPGVSGGGAGAAASDVGSVRAVPGVSGGTVAPGAGSGAAHVPAAPIDLARTLRLSLAAPAGTPGRLRPVASAGALHPVRAHLLTGPGCSLPPGRYAYDSRTHRAHPRGAAPGGVPPGALLVLTVTASRTVAHYGHRAWPLLLLDAGHAAAALTQAGSPTADVLVSFDADGPLLSAAAGLPRASCRPEVWPGSEPELPLAAVWFTPPGTAVDSVDPLSGWTAGPGAGAPPPPPGAATAPPDELAATQGLLRHLAEAPGLPAGTWHPSSRPAGVTDDVLEARRSAAPDELRHPPERGLLARVLATARTACPAGPDWTLVVGGDTPALHAVAPGRPGLHVRARGDARPTLAHWAARQRWIGASGAVLLAHGCPEDAPPAVIRHSHLAAGYAVGVAQIHATALGLRSRPVGSWQQADLGAALGDAPGRDWIVHGLALGGVRRPS
ncbi:nitroreductase [Streptomyces sp. NPDC087897]|uniref:nitroreductase n=1 Tax=Streptomyces sp. NPDC087897 TaxID=3365817 RepID=UPI003815D6C1